MENNNNKLGLAQQVCTQGLTPTTLCNGGAWERKLRDIREYLKLFDGLRDPMKTVTFLSYTEHGAFVVSLAPHTENPGNYKAAWIYVPNTVEISGDELERACNKTKDFLLSRCSIDVLKGYELFSKTYPEKVGIDYSPSTKENKFGVFYMNNRCHLEEILGNYLYQENFSKYDAVFLLEENGDISITGNSPRITNLSKEHLKEYYVLHCPDTQNIHGQPKIYLNGQPFDKDVRVKRGGTLSLILKRSGFCDEQVKISVTDEKSIEHSEIEKLIKERTWKKQINLDIFDFRGKDGNPIKDKRSIHVEVNREAVDNGIYVEETACMKAEIKVVSKNYELVNPEKGYNLLEAPVKITLKRKPIRTKIQLANGEKVEITLESQYPEDDYISKEKSPLKGYSYGIQGSTLYPDETGKWTSYAIGALAILAIEIIALCCYQIGTSILDYWDNHYIEWTLPPTIEKKHGETEPRYESIEEVPQKPEEKDFTQVLNYLEGNDVWSKEELDKYPETVELFDALNRFDSEAVERIYKEELSGQSTKLKQIVDAFSDNREKDFRRGKEANNGLYNKENDYKINVANYLNWLSDYRAPTTSQQPTTKTGQTSGNIGSSETKKSTGKTADTFDPRKPENEEK